MERHTQDKIWLTIAKTMATLVVAFFVYSFTSVKTTIRIEKLKNGFIEVEFAHTPLVGGRELYIEGTTPLFYSNSGEQLDGEKCAVVHRRKWRVPPYGILSIAATVYDSNGKVIQQETKNFVMGPEPEQQ